MISPSAGEYLMALDNRLSKMMRIFSSIAHAVNSLALAFDDQTLGHDGEFLRVDHLVDHILHRHRCGIEGDLAIQPLRRLRLRIGEQSPGSTAPRSAN